MLIRLSICFQVLIWLLLSSETTSFNLPRLRLSDMLKVQKTGKFFFLLSLLMPNTIPLRLLKDCRYFSFTNYNSHRNVSHQKISSKRGLSSVFALVSGNINFCLKLKNPITRKTILFHLFKVGKTARRINM